MQWNSGRLHRQRGPCHSHKDQVYSYLGEMVLTDEINPSKRWPKRLQHQPELQLVDSSQTLVCILILVSLKLVAMGRNVNEI